MADITR